MDKNAVKKYAVWARRELIDRVSQRAALYEITADGYGDRNAASVHGRVLTDEEKKQRQALIDRISEKGYELVMEKIAYTWFNRFSALRFMEVNGYLPSRVRVFTDEENRFRPQILAEAINLNIDGLEMEKVFELKNNNKDEELFKYLLITQCNALSEILPGMFQKISDYTELLLPDFLLREGSVIEQMITLIPQENWTDQVQIIGWLYQYYNTEPKDEVFAGLKKNVKITKENIPAATQLFTPDWIVRYMVENSLGRLWLEGHPNESLKAEWKYYLDETEQEPEVEAQLAEIRKEYAALKPEEILVIDPCQGSGHILSYMFDVLVKIYEAYGYTAREAASAIVENNLWGLDIDDRAAQLAYFSVMMKARQYERRFFRKKDENGELCIPQPHVYAIQESNNLDPHCIEYFTDGREDLKSAMDTLMEELHDAKEYGSILNVTPVDFDALHARFEEIRNEAMPGIYSRQALDVLLPFVQSAQALAQNYHVVVTNPPYMGASGMGAKLSKFVKKNYSDSKSDLFAVFIEQCGKMIRKNGYQAMITQHAWMFLSSFEKLRVKIQTIDTVNMAHLGPRAFEEIGGEVVQTTCFVFQNNHISDRQGLYCRLIEPTTQQGKEELFLTGKNRYVAKQDSFTKIPGAPVAYWVSSSFSELFKKKYKIADVSFPKQGIHTGNNNLYLRYWQEVDFSKINLTESEIWDERFRWAKLNKGGNYRKWYGNREYVLLWSNNGEAIKTNGKSVGANNKSFLKNQIGFTDVTSYKPSFRYYGKGFVFDVSGPAIPNSGNLFSDEFLLSLLNSKVTEEAMQILSPTIHMNQTALSKVSTDRLKKNTEKHTEQLSSECISLSKSDWDSFETSWDFTEHPFITAARQAAENGESITLEQAFENWQSIAEERFYKLKENEEELNRIFIDIYGLQDELTPEVEDKDVTVRRADLQRDIRSFISYAVGCMFGRYSLDEPGLAFAGGTWDPGRYTTFLPDKDAIIPICDDEYFEDDIVGRFVDFVRIVYGKETLEENLRFIADALDGKGSSREIIRNYFISEFYKDHCKVYKKRPIYWLFDSSRKNGFKCLVYIHRYAPDTVARIRTDYVHEQQSRYRTTIADLENRISAAASSEKVKLKKQLTRVQAQAEEIRAYEEKIHHFADQMIAIDLDDGVKHNYAIFKDVLAKIR